MRLRGRSSYFNWVNYSISCDLYFIFVEKKKKEHMISRVKTFDLS